ncbi:MAG: hypothetical protein Q9172_006454 [Xanthocarpia lactea]
MDSDSSAKRANEDGEKGIPLDSVAEQVSERSIKSIKWLLVILGTLSSAFLFALDNSIVADIQPQIIQQFPGSIDKLPWLSVAFALGGAASTLVWYVDLMSWFAGFNGLVWL